jgi:nucleotide-binding universal stress UspA family protein
MPGIIVGVDGSGCSQRALEWAAREAAAHRAPLTVLTVHQAAADIYGAVAEYPDDADRTQKARDAVQAETDKVLAKLGEDRPESVTVTAVHGFPVDELVKASEGADLLVMGRRGAGGLVRLLLGSTAYAVTQHARSPVMLVPPEDRG